MKLIITTLFLISNLTLLSLSNQIIGNYYRKLGNEENHLIEYKLKLNEDGTYAFHSYSKNKQGIPPEVNLYGKGTWSEKDNVITFFSNKSKNCDKTYTLDFNNSKARFVAKHPRDKTDRIIKTSLQFFESEIFWIETINSFKL